MCMETDFKKVTTMREREGWRGTWATLVISISLKTEVAIIKQMSQHIYLFLSLAIGIYFFVCFRMSSQLTFLLKRQLWASV